MTQPGVITEVKNGMMEITFCRKEACAACNACEGGKREHKIRVRGSGRVGDIALVEMPDQIIVRASAMAYGVPLVGMVAGLLLGSAVSQENIWGPLMGALLGLGAGLTILKLTEKKRSSHPDWNPRVVEILKGGSAAEE